MALVPFILLSLLNFLLYRTMTRLGTFSSWRWLSSPSFSSAFSTSSTGLSPGEGLLYILLLVMALILFILLSLLNFLLYRTITR
jgi:hypothetical protein